MIPRAVIECIIKDIDIRNEPGIWETQTPRKDKARYTVENSEKGEKNREHAEIKGKRRKGKGPFSVRLFHSPLKEMDSRQKGLAIAR
jgi:hypothetical protein